MGLKLKDEFPLTRDKVYFNSAVIGACPESTIRVVEKYEEDLAGTLRGGGDFFEGLAKYADRKANSKKLFAEIVGAKEGEVAFIPNASTGINTAFSMIPCGKGSNIVATTLSFPMCATVVNKQRDRGAEPRFIEHKGGVVETEEFEKAVDDDTAAVLVDQAGWFNGYLHDLKAISEIAHDHGALLVVDATQSVGGIKWDARGWGVDMLATSTYKWLLGGPFNQSAGFFYMSEEIVDDYQPAYVGGQSIDPERSRRNSEDRFDLYEFTPRKGIARLEIYPRFDVAYVAVENSMKVLLDHGLENIERQTRKVASKLVDGLLESGHELQTAKEEARRLYLNAKVPDYKAVVDKLYMQAVHVSPRVGGIRISPNFYNTTEEAEVFLEKLNKLAN